MGRTNQTGGDQGRLESPRPCHLCGAHALEELVAYRAFRRVTSDCKPWPAGGQLYLCRECGGVQKFAGPDWLREAEVIYADYCLYPQGAGAEQAVFDQSSGSPSPRSRRLLESFGARFPLPRTGRMLDVGCGNGAMLRAFSQHAPHWSLAGTELNDKHRSAIEQIPGSEPLYNCPPDRVPGTFDLITMIHVLEHIARPAEFLSSLRRKLTVEGLLLIEVPDHLQNPFDLLIADHGTHFTAGSAAALVARSGYQLLAAAEDWVPKEISVVARNRHADVCSGSCGAPQHEPLHGAGCSAWPAVATRLQWLGSVVDAARRLVQEPAFGCFGTSIAATWLFAELEGAVRFFVDEDPQRVGRTFCDRPILYPSQVPEGSHVFFALAPGLGESIRRRLTHVRATFHLPPPL